MNYLKIGKKWLTMIELQDINNETSDEQKKAKNSFEKLYAAIKKLRSEQGCPWDKNQTPLSMRSDLIEETFEAVDAITQNDVFHTKEELGDVFLNALMILYMYEQEKYFNVSDVFDEVVEKIVRRHPHVWENSEGKENANEKKATTSEEVLLQWENIKQGIEGRKKNSILNEISEGLPPLMLAYKMQKKAAKKGFDWQDIESVWKKVEEELNELHEATKEKNQQNIEEEMGDVFFSVVNLARKLKVDPNVALARSNEKFKKRFSYVEKQCEKNAIPMNNENLKQMDNFWEESKNY